jgi:AcrR family transcriptional regulator
MATDGLSRQSRKTRAALLQAFNGLAVERRYADIRIADVIRRADVGRSTFYEHFRNKDDVLRQSLAGLLGIVAAAVEEGCDTTHLRFVLDHFRENSALARGLINGPSAPQVVAVLAGLIEQRLAAAQQRLDLAPVIALDLAAAQLAGGQLGLVQAWLNRGATAPPAAVAAAMHRCAAAAARAVFS